MSFSALASRIAALSGALATAGLNISDDALRALLSVSDDFGDDLARAIAGGGDDLTRFINANADDITRAMGNSGDDALQGLRAIATSPAMMRTFSTFFNGMDDILGNFARSGADDFGRYVSQNFDDIAAQYGDDFAQAVQRNATRVQTHLARATQVIDDAAAAASSTLDDATRATLDDAARTGTPPSGWSTLDRMALNSSKLGLFAKVGGVAAIGGLIAEMQAGYPASTWLAHRSLDIAEGLEDIDPELARLFAEGGTNALLFLGELNDATRNAGVNYVATMLEESGRGDAGMGLRIGNILASPMLYARVAEEMVTAGDDADVAVVLVDYIENGGIPREQLTEYFNNSPTMRRMVEERIGADLTSALPDLAPMEPSAPGGEPEAPAITDADQQRLLGMFNRMATATGSEGRFAVAQEIAADESFSFGDNQVMGMNLNSMMFSAFSWAAQNLSWIPGLGDTMRNMAIAQVTAAGASQFGDVAQFNTVFAQIRGTAADVVAEVTRDPTAPTLS